MYDRVMLNLNDIYKKYTKRGKEAYDPKTKPAKTQLNYLPL